MTLMEFFGWRLQDVFLAKASKRSPLVLRMVVLISAMFCGLYIFSICINQTDYKFRQAKPLKIQVIDRRNHTKCRNTGIQEPDLHYVHFPEPESFSRQECACNPVRLFAIVSMQRSGSGWFETLLNSHMNLSSNGEIFGPSERRNNVSMIYKTLDKVYNLDWFSSAAKNECSAAVGFKWMINQGLMEHHEEVADYFNTRGVSLIFLLRRNLLRRMISLLANTYDKNVKLLNGTHKSHVHSPHEAEVLAGYKPTLNVTTLVSTIRAAEGTAARALECFKTTRHIVLYYEDIVANHTVRFVAVAGTVVLDSMKTEVDVSSISFILLQKLVQVQEFLKLPAQNLTSGQVKIHSGPLSRYVANWEDVRKKLEGTSYENLLNTDYKS
ncbi:UNVERIFIED_CONTAM: hypothetical protein Sradi_3764400 [Sesamum radiatum]|uniref:Sulfotransferase n=1 Tax=Sesamum radiatum TaxID=300843 RepID=A0AAW2PZA5_SESRA